MPIETVERQKNFLTHIFRCLSHRVILRHIVEQKHKLATHPLPSPSFFKVIFKIPRWLIKSASNDSEMPFNTIKT